MKIRFVLRCISLLLCMQTSFAQQTPQWGSWLTWGDQSDGTYRNPVLPAEYSDYLYPVPGSPTTQLAELL